MLTPYESTGTLTTVAAGDAWVDTLAAAHPGWVQVSTWGSSVAGVPIRSVTVGTGPVSVCVVSTVHGTEPAGREAVYGIMRDLAETTDPALVAYLEDHAWSFVPTPNPDGRTANTRDNANDVDLNREFGGPVQPEAVAVAAWLTDCAPVMGLDMHETSNNAIPDVAYVPQVHPAHVAQMQALSADLCADIGAALTGRDYILYPFDNTTAGTLTVEYGRVWHATGMTLETQRWAHPNPAPLAPRVTAHLTALDAALTHHRANQQTYEDVHVLAGGGTVDPDPDPPTESGLFRTNGDPVTLARTNGDPVTLT